MILVDMHQAKASLSELIERARGGEEVVVTDAGRPVAKIVAYETGEQRKPGLLSGMVIGPDFDELPPDFAEAIDAGVFPEPE
jgi:prevent-host-death family protein